MNYLQAHLEFTTVEEGEKQLADAYAIRDKMGGALYYSILTDDCKEISQKLERLRRESVKNTVCECKVCGESFDNNEDYYHHYDEKHNKETDV